MRQSRTCKVSYRHRFKPRNHHVNSGLFRQTDISRQSDLTVLYSAFEGSYVSCHRFTPIPTTLRFSCLMIRQNLKLPLDSGQRDALDKVTLGEEEEEDYRDDHHYGGGHEESRFGRVSALVERQGVGEWHLDRRAYVNQRPEEVVPGLHEGQNGHRGERRLDERQHDPPVDSEERAAVDL